MENIAIGEKMIKDLRQYKYSPKSEEEMLELFNYVLEEEKEG